MAHKHKWVYTCACGADAGMIVAELEQQLQEARTLLEEGAQLDTVPGYGPMARKLAAKMRAFLAGEKEQSDGQHV